MLEDADALYGLALDEFTGARDALAKRLRSDKRRDEADAVRALRKPSLAAWAINQAVRGHPDETRALLDAGAALREAHEALVGGGDADAVRTASDNERDAIRRLTRLASDALGPRASEATAEKIRSTLRAASADEEVRERVGQGRLERDAEGAATGWPLTAGEAPAGGQRPAPRRRSASDAPKRTASGSPKRSRSATPSAAASEADRRRKDAAGRARREAERTQEAAADAEAAAASARETLAEAEEAARGARSEAERADGAERAARRAVKEAEAEAERRRTEARRALKAAEARG